MGEGRLARLDDNPFRQATYLPKYQVLVSYPNLQTGYARRNLQL